VTDHDLLAFEAQWWRHAGANEQAIRGQLGLTPVRYYQRLNAAVDTVDALAAQPILVSGYGGCDPAGRTQGRCAVAWTEKRASGRYGRSDRSVERPRSSTGAPDSRSTTGQPSRSSISNSDVAVKRPVPAADQERGGGDQICEGHGADADEF